MDIKKIKEILNRNKSFTLFSDAENPAKLNAIRTTLYYRNKIDVIKKAAEIQINNLTNNILFSLFFLLLLKALAAWLTTAALPTTGLAH